MIQPVGMAQLVYRFLHRALAEQTPILQFPVEGGKQPRQGDEGVASISLRLTEDKVEPKSVAVGVNDAQHALGVWKLKVIQRAEDILASVLSAARIVGLCGTLDLVCSATRQAEGGPQCSSQVMENTRFNITYWNQKNPECVCVHRSHRSGPNHTRGAGRVLTEIRAVQSRWRAFSTRPLSLVQVSTSW